MWQLELKFIEKMIIFFSLGYPELRAKYELNFLKHIWLVFNGNYNNQNFTMKQLQVHSFSAPKLLTTSSNCISHLRLSQVSPGVSPSVYRILNIALESPMASDISSFFLEDMQRSAEEDIGDLSPINEKNLSKTIFFSRKAKSASTRSKIHFAIIPEENFEDHKEAVFPRLVQKIIPKISSKNVILQNPPKRYHKRKQRCELENEKTTIKKFVGKIKNYNLRKRFGFIKVEDENKLEVFVCEDDLVLSGVNFKQFKDQIYKKQPVRMRFHISKHILDGKEMQKAVEIEVIESE